MLRLICVLAACIALSHAVVEKREIGAYKTPETPNQRSLTTVPDNTHVMAGNTVVFPCAVADFSVSRVQWFEFVTTGQAQLISDNSIILPSHPNAHRYSIIQVGSNNDFYLEIAATELADGGTYVCLDANSGPPETYSWQIELVVIGANPNCSTIVPENGIVLEGQNYTEACQIYYSGNLAPTMHWEGPEPFLKTLITNEDDVYSAILFTVDRGMDTLAYRCLTNFTQMQGAPGGVADNAPTYEHIFQFQQLFVYWGPKNLYAVPMKPTYNVGDVVTCYADAFPDPFYEWQNLITTERINSQVFTVTEAMVGLNTTMRCQAQNLIQGFLYSANIFIYVYVPEPTTAEPTTTVPSTTTPAPEGPCDNLTGWWISDDPYAEMHLSVANDHSGRVQGFMRNFTDQQWVEVIGRTRISDFLYLGLTAIWPYEIGITGMAAECHKCFGVEVIMSAGQWRSYYDSASCGDGGTPEPYVSYRFRRVSDTLASQQQMHSPDFKVANPSKLVSGSLGLKHLQY